jgi:hypothetical protein
MGDDVMGDDVMGDDVMVDDVIMVGDDVWVWRGKHANL